LKFIGKVRRTAPAHVAQRHFEAAKTCKIQCADKSLRPEGAANTSSLYLAVTPSPSRNRPSAALLSDILFSFHFSFSGSPAALENLRWQLRRSWAKADNPFWSNHVVAWYRSALEAETYRIF
jgi:hypothetical protein